MSTRRFVSTLELSSAAIQHPQGPEGPAVLRVPVLPEGQFDHPVYGVLLWTAERFGRMIQNFKQKVTGFQPMLNACHATFNPFAPDAPAYGWVTELEYVKGDGLFALVELTKLGIDAIENRLYRYISAEVNDQHENSRGQSFTDVILGMALTNTPFHDSMPGLFGAAPEVGLLRQLVAGLPEWAQRFAMDGAPSFGDICRAIEEALEHEAERSYHYPRLVDVYPDFFIYQEDWDSEEPYWKRGYTMAGREVTLGPVSERTEVERVWVVKAQAAMQAALQHTGIKLGRVIPSPVPAGNPAKGGKGMSQGQRPSLWQMFTGMLGLKPDATPEQFKQALEAAPAPAGEPAANPGTFTAPAGMVLMSQADVEALKQTGNDFAAFQRKQAEAEADRQIARFQAEGKLTPAMLDGEAGKKLREFAIANPEAFQQVYEAAPAVVRFSAGAQLHAHRPGSSGNPTEGQGAQSFESAVEARMEKDACDYVTALERVADEDPELYESYLAASAPRRA